MNRRTVEASDPVAARRSALGILRAVLPWLVGVAILLVVGARVQLAAFRDALGHGAYVTLAIVDLVVTVIVLGTDSVSTWIGLSAVHMKRPFPRVVAVRGATNQLFLINYALGQGGFGYYLHRTGATAMRAAGTTLFLMGTNFATLVVLTSAAWAVFGADGSNAAMRLTLIAGCVAFAAYLVVILISPRFLARHQILAPLFAAGVRGHSLAMLGRLPHVTVVVLGHWVAMRSWGIPVPFGAALTGMPAVAIAAVLPISPGGLGTTQAAMVHFFSSFAAGANADERAGAVLAFAIVHFVYVVLVTLGLGLVCTWFATRQAQIAEATSLRHTAVSGEAQEQLT
jgi:hypothetical protein